MLILHRDQARIAAGRRRVGRDDLLMREALEIVRAAGLRSGARQPHAAEGLRADDRADGVAVHVDVADRSARAIRSARPPTRVWMPKVRP